MGAIEILSRDGKLRGVVKNLQSRPCSMVGCTGMRMHVKWENGKTTYPCSKGCTWLSENLLKIG